MRKDRRRTPFDGPPVGGSIWLGGIELCAPRRSLSDRVRTRRADPRAWTAREFISLYPCEDCRRVSDRATHARAATAPMSSGGTRRIRNRYLKGQVGTLLDDTSRRWIRQR